MSRWDRYVLRPRVRAETPESETVPHIGPYTPPGVQSPWWCGPTLGRAVGPPGLPGPPLAAPLRLYLLPVMKPSRTEPFFASSPLFRRRHRFKIGAARRPFPGTLPEGGLTSGASPPHGCFPD